MHRATRWVAAGLAAAALGLGATVPARIQAVAPGERTFFDTLVLLRWGYGALDWLQTDSHRGDAHVRER